jgi:ribosomal protein L33
MIKNLYFKCETCGNVVTKFMDSVYKDEVLKSLVCEHCGGNNFVLTTNVSTTPTKIKNKVKDYRGLDKEKYMSQEYKDIRENINRVHKEKRGLLGDKRIFS